MKNRKTIGFDDPNQPEKIQTCITPERSETPCPVSYKADLEKKWHQEESEGRLIKSSDVKGLFQESFDNAHQLCRVIQKNWATTRPLHIFAWKELQQGKTSDIKAFLATCCHNIPVNERLFISGDPQKKSFEQNKKTLSKVVTAVSLVKLIKSIDRSTSIARHSSFVSIENETGEIDLSKIKILIVDEHQMGVGEESLTSSLLLQLYDYNPYLIVIAITATPAGFSDLKVDWVRLKGGNGYYGIKQFSENGQLYEISECYEGGDFKQKPNLYIFDQVAEDGSYQVHLKDHLKENIDRLGKRDLPGSGFIRYENPKELAPFIQNYIASKGYDIEVLTAHCNSNMRIGDLKANEAQSALHNEVMVNQTHCIIIFTGIYKAGNDIDHETQPHTPKEFRMKENTCFGYEGGDPNFNTHLQSIPGRFCGYHKNTSVRIYCHVGLSKIYCDLYSGKIKIEQLDDHIAQSGLTRSKSQRLVEPATHAKIDVPKENKSRESYTPMKGFRITGERIEDLLMDLSSYESGMIEIGYDLTPVQILLKSYYEENQKKFFKVGKGERVAVRRTKPTRYNSKDYIANGKAYSNYNVKPETKIQPELDSLKDSGMISLERFTKKNPNVNVCFLADDKTGREFAIWICLKIEDNPFQAIISKSNDVTYSTAYQNPKMKRNLGS